MVEATMETAARLRRAITRLNRKLRYNALGSVTPAQASMLATINKLSSPSLGDLALAEQIQPPSVTRLIRSMEQAKLVVLREDDVDRRCTRVELTNMGRKELLEIRRRKTEFLERRLLALSLDDQQKALDAVIVLEALLDES
jgi:DNA-binding MarR family transcriptional regulator